MTIKSDDLQGRSQLLRGLAEGQTTSAFSSCVVVSLGSPSKREGRIAYFSSLSSKS